MIFMFSYHGLWPDTPPRLLHAPLTAILALQFVRAASGVDGTRYFSPALGFSIHWWGGRLSALTHVTRCAASYVLAQGGLGFPLSLDYLSGLYCQISGLCPPLISASSYFLTIVTCLRQQDTQGVKGPHLVHGIAGSHRCHHFDEAERSGLDCGQVDYNSRLPRITLSKYRSSSATQRWQ